MPVIRACSNNSKKYVLIRDVSIENALEKGTKNLLTLSKLTCIKEERNACHQGMFK